jgi:hypothetical protein
MNFEELQKIWDTQNKQTLYAINETAMYNHIMQKQRQARHITHISELLTILANAGAGIFIGIAAATSSQTSIALYILSAWMVACAVFIVRGRIHRFQGNRRFDRSMNGELAYALAVTTHQVRLSRLMRLNILPIALLLLLGLWETGKPAWIAAATAASLLLSYYASGWEHSYYENRRRSLQNLQASLMQNATPTDISEH